MSQDESDRVGREARAASEILEAMNEERLERIASAQLAGMTKPDYLTAVEAAQLAETALVLAKYLAAYLDKEG